MESSSVSYVGTIIGVTTGSTYLLNTLLFSNLAFIVDYIGKDLYGATIFLSSLLLISIGCFYKQLKQEFLSFECIKKCCPKKLKSYHITRTYGE